MKPLVLILGVRLADDPHSLATTIEACMRQSKHYGIVQLWQPLVQPYVPKFTLLNKMLRGLRSLLEMFEYVIITDDDITVPEQFLDNYLRLVRKYDFALAQPARTTNSHIHHPIVARVRGVKARRTHFVEIGPLFSMNQAALKLLTPFDECSPMGWGYDYVWPQLINEHALRMGIVDATPVEHTVREPVSGYVGAGEQMAGYLSQHLHLSPEAAYVEIERYVS